MIFTDTHSIAWIRKKDREKRNLDDGGQKSLNALSERHQHFIKNTFYLNLV